MKNGNWQDQRTLTPLQFKRLSKKLGMNIAASGRYIGVSTRRIRRIVKGQSQIPASAVLLLRSLEFHGEVPQVPKWEKE